MAEEEDDTHATETVQENALDELCTRLASESQGLLSDLLELTGIADSEYNSDNNKVGFKVVATTCFAIIESLDDEFGPDDYGPISEISFLPGTRQLNLTPSTVQLLRFYQYALPVIRSTFVQVCEQLLDVSDEFSEVYGKIVDGMRTVHELAQKFAVFYPAGALGTQREIAEFAGEYEELLRRAATIYNLSYLGNDKIYASEDQGEEVAGESPERHEEDAEFGFSPVRDTRTSSTNTPVKAPQIPSANTPVKPPGASSAKTPDKAEPRPDVRFMTPVKGSQQQKKKRDPASVAQVKPSPLGVSDLILEENSNLSPDASKLRGSREQKIIPEQKILPDVNDLGPGQPRAPMGTVPATTPRISEQAVPPERPIPNMMGGFRQVEPGPENWTTRDNAGFSAGDGRFGQKFGSPFKKREETVRRSNPKPEVTESDLSFRFGQMDWFDFRPPESVRESAPQPPPTAPPLPPTWIPLSSNPTPTVRPLSPEIPRKVPKKKSGRMPESMGLRDEFGRFMGIGPAIGGFSGGGHGGFVNGGPDLRDRFASMPDLGANLPPSAPGRERQRETRWKPPKGFKGPIDERIERMREPPGMRGSRGEFNIFTPRTPVRNPENLSAAAGGAGGGGDDPGRSGGGTDYTGRRKRKGTKKRDDDNRMEIVGEEGPPWNRIPGNGHPGGGEDERSLGSGDSSGSEWSRDGDSGSSGSSSPGGGGGGSGSSGGGDGPVPRDRGKTFRFYRYGPRRVGSRLPKPDDPSESSSSSSDTDDADARVADTRNRRRNRARRRREARERARGAAAAGGGGEAAPVAAAGGGGEAAPVAAAGGGGEAAPVAAAGGDDDPGNSSSESGSGSEDSEAGEENADDAEENPEAGEENPEAGARGPPSDPSSDEWNIGDTSSEDDGGDISPRARAAANLRLTERMGRIHTREYEARIRNRVENRYSRQRTERQMFQRQRRIEVETSTKKDVGTPSQVVTIVSSLLDKLTHVASLLEQFKEFVNDGGLDLFRDSLTSQMLADCLSLVQELKLEYNTVANRQLELIAKSFDLRAFVRESNLETLTLLTRRCNAVYLSTKATLSQVKAKIGIVTDSENQTITTNCGNTGNSDYILCGNLNPANFIGELSDSVTLTKFTVMCCEVHYQVIKSSDQIRILSATRDSRGKNHLVAVTRAKILDPVVPADGRIFQLYYATYNFVQHVFSRYRVFSFPPIYMLLLFKSSDLLEFDTFEIAGRTVQLKLEPGNVDRVVTIDALGAETSETLDLTAILAEFQRFDARITDVFKIAIFCRV